jgi:hypothetical protein
MAASVRHSTVETSPLLVRNEDAATSDSSRRSARRLDYVDQFRGFTMFSMILVNFLGDGGFNATPAFFKHGKYYVSYPDLVMPGFLFATGLSFRLSHLRNVKTLGAWKARFKVLIPRTLGLLILSYWLYGFGGERVSWAESLALTSEERAVNFIGTYFGALTQIALTTLWCLPVIERSMAARLCYAIASLLVYFAYIISVAELTSIYAFMTATEGGPVGFLSWSVPFMAGTMLCDGLKELSLSLPPLLPSSQGPLSDEDDAMVEVKPGCSGAIVAVTRTAWVYVTAGGKTLLGIDTKTRVAPTPAAVRKRLLLLAVGGTALLVAGYLLSLLAMVAPIFCFDRETGKPTDCVHVPVPLPPLIVPKNPYAHVIVTAWNPIQCWITFALIATGFQVLVCTVCYWVCDVQRWRMLGLHDVFDGFGRNTLLAYIFHFGARRQVANLIPADAPGYVVFFGLLLCMGTLYLAMAHLRHQKLFVGV